MNRTLERMAASCGAVYNERDCDELFSSEPQSRRSDWVADFIAAFGVVMLFVGLASGLRFW